MAIHTKAQQFRGLHTSETIVRLPNCWDAASARILQDLGAPAVATTSAAVAWSLGLPDGDALDRSTAVTALRHIVNAVSVPVSADIESGYGRTPGEVAATVLAVVDAGAVGVNIEDVHPDDPSRLRGISENAERLAAARSAAEESDVDLFINARIDTYLRQSAPGTPADTSRYDDTVLRARAYVEAGANGVFVPGAVDSATIKGLADAIDAPLNIMLTDGCPMPDELEALGVARVTVGEGFAATAYSAARRSAHEFLGNAHALQNETLGYAELNALMGG